MTVNNEQLKKQLEAEQDARLNAVNRGNHPSSEEIANQIAKNGFKIDEIKGAFRVEEDMRKEIERERDDNLHAYLEEREEKVKLIKEVNALNKTLQEKDKNKVEQEQLIREQRDSEYTQSATEKQLTDQSRQNFKELLESRTKFRQK